MKKILVLLSTYNGSQYLIEQLESLLNQKHVSVSILVRDDGSFDGTNKILDSYMDEGKLIWYTGKHLNVQKSYFDLMQHATKYNVDYFAFCDQDDVWDIDKLYIATQYLDNVASSVPALYYCGQRLVDSNLKLIHEHNLNERRTLFTRFVLSDFAGCTGVFNMALLNEVVKYEPKYMLMHDTWILKVCLCLGGQVFIDPRAHIDYRQHNGNTIGLKHNWWASLKQVVQYINKYHVELQIQELMRGYGERMLPEYRELSILICQYKKNGKYKKNLLNRKYINFYNWGLNLTYRIKVLLNKL